MHAAAGNISEAMYANSFNVLAAPVQRTRLGIDFHVWDELYQGSRSHLLGLYKAAIVQAPDIDFVFFLDGTASLRTLHAEFRQTNVTLVHMPARPGLVRLGAQLPWLARRHRIDLLHTQYRLPLWRLGWGRFGAACACTIHDVLFETHPQYFPRLFTWQSRFFYRQAARRARLLLTVSAFSRQEIARHYGVPPEAIVLTPNAADGTRFFPGDAGADTVRALGLVPGRYLLTVGRLEPRKNHATLIEAYAQLPADAPDLVIVGQRDFHYAAALDAIRRHRLQSRVRVLENVGDVALPAVLRHALLFIYPSFAEGFGMPVLEAMVSGVPVITSDTTSLPEVGGNAAQWIDPFSAPAMTQAMARLIAEAALRQQMIAAGLAQARRFDWDDAAAALLAGVRHCLSASPESPKRP